VYYVCNIINIIIINVCNNIINVCVCENININNILLMYVMCVLILILMY